MSAEAPLPTDAQASADGDSALEFRAVANSGKRRGIRLERVFWRALEAIARERRIRLGALVEDIAAGASDAANLSSALRVACMRAYASRVEELDQLWSPRTIEAILAASPAAAFTLAANRRIVSFNTGFSTLVRRQFAGMDGDSSKLDLRLSLDVAVEELLARLDANGNAPVVTGFLLTMDARRHRGQVNVMRVPSKDSGLLMAFVAA